MLVATKNIVAAAVLLAAGGLLILRNEERQTAQAAGSTGRRILYYHDPMHPAYRSDKPGRAPDCGMALEPVYAAEAPKQAPDAIRITAERQQLIGLRLGAAEKTSSGGLLRTTGRVVPDETLVYPVTTKVDGWVREVPPLPTGTLVRKGQPLVAVYSKELITYQQSYIFALQQIDRHKNGDEPDALDRLQAQLKEALAVLQSLGVASSEIETAARTRKALEVLHLVAPSSGILVSRNVFPEQRFDKGVEFFRIVDLSRVWIQADIFEQDCRSFGAGSSATVIAPHRPNRRLTATVSDSIPKFDPVSRTLKLRLTIDNRDLALQPDMFVDVEFARSRPASVTVPAEAILDSGLKKTVFVYRGDGLFEPRTVSTGERWQNRVEITSGLEAGERIVVSGTFLLDSESQLRAPAGTHE